MPNNDRPEEMPQEDARFNRDSVPSLRGPSALAKRPIDPRVLPPEARVKKLWAERFGAFRGRWTLDGMTPSADAIIAVYKKGKTERLKVEQTDAEGCFTILDLADGDEYDVKVIRVASEEVLFEWLAQKFTAGTPIDLRPEAQFYSTITGTVTNDGIEPVRGLRVLLYRAGAPYEGGSKVGRAQTDENGCFNIRVPDPRDYVVRVTRPDGRRVYYESPQVTAKANESVPLPTDPVKLWATITGEVWLDDKTPADGATVVAYPAGADMSLDSESARVVTHRSGRFADLRVYAGHYNILITLDRSRLLLRDVSLEAGKGRDLGKDFGDGKKVTLTGTIRGEVILNGKAEVDATVLPVLGGVALKPTKTVAQGAFTLSGLPPNSYTLSVTSKDGTKRRPWYFSVAANEIKYVGPLELGP
jgi:Carboxypeptidase regulatory-like domain